MGLLYNGYFLIWRAVNMNALRCLCFEDDPQDRTRIGAYFDTAWSLVDKRALDSMFPGKNLGKIDIDFSHNQQDAIQKIRSSVGEYSLFLVDFFEKNGRTGEEENVGIPLAAIARALSTSSRSVLGIIGLTKDTQRLYYLERDFKRKASLPQPGPNGTFGYAFYSKNGLFVNADVAPDDVARSLSSILIDAGYGIQHAKVSDSGRLQHPAQTNIRIFVSHSHDDVGLAKRLVDLLTKALKIDSREIRCTSVPGFDLSGGDPSAQVIRDNLQDCDVVIGLITEKSLSSHFVLFELGAAWGLGARLVPILGPGYQPSIVRAPLSDYHACKWGVRQHWEKLIDDLSSWLTIEKETNLPVYSRLIDEIISIST
jgi:hypothetical protein